jgi:DinB superfamily
MSEPEVWLRGPLPDVAPLLQPVAHSLLQCRSEVRETLPALERAHVWARPGGAAPIGYHARHAIGSLDRLLTYARGEQLSLAQLDALKVEGLPNRDLAIATTLVTEFDAAVERALMQVRATQESTLTEPREVGRARLPSTVIGLLFHAAEHTQRHVGQLGTTAKIVRAAQTA